jgi:hypothetical protein
MQMQQSAKSHGRPQWLASYERMLFSDDQIFLETAGLCRLVRKLSSLNKTPQCYGPFLNLSKHSSLPQVP